jgi:endonuclease/exonuclease/phosphatase family metal-dependent hydrolase
MKIRVMSYNIHKGFSFFNTKFILHELKKAIQEVHADIILLQEVVGENKIHAKNKSDWPTESQFEFLADQIWPHFSYGKNAIYNESHHGNAILSKFPIIMSENINISNHPIEQRGLLHVEIELPEQSGTLHIFNTHLDLTQMGRKQQIKKIIKRAQEHVPPDTPFIIGGDFNDWNHQVNHSFSEFLQLSEAFHASTGQSATTFPSFLPLLKLDRLYYRKFKVVKTHKLTGAPFQQLSDHIPIVADLILS